MAVTKGIDLSKWNGDVDFKKVKDSGVKFVILREGFGLTEDPMFDEYVKGCEKVGIPILGIYHFSYALSMGDAKAEADFTIHNLTDAMLGREVKIFFDYEYDSVTYARSNGLAPTKDTCTSITKAFCDRVTKLGYTPGVYYNVDFEKNWYLPGFLDNYTRWVADWRYGVDHPEATFHQFNSKGSVPGIIGNVDMNYMNDVKMEAKPDESPITGLAREVIDGKWGNGLFRQTKILSAVQKEVNRLLKG